jgi:hypothetical protein
VKFPWQRRPPKDDTHLADAQHAVEQALSDWPQVEAITSKARALRETDGFTSAIIKAMGP